MTVAVKLAEPRKTVKKIYIRKHQAPSAVIEKIKLWPSRTGVLHGVRSIKVKGFHMEILTHCGQVFKVRNSKTGRVARWLRNKWHANACKHCKIPSWKLEKYSVTRFN